MENIAVINSCNDGSIGKIARKLHNYLLTEGYNSHFYFARWHKIDDKNSIKFESNFEVKLHGLLCRLTGFQGTFSNLATNRLLKHLDKLKVDAIFVVNLHGYYLNEAKLLKYAGERNIPLVYIMADEYPAWGKCGFHGDCIKYLDECRNCPKYKEYPNSWFFDRAHDMYKLKENAYNTLKRVAFVGPEYTIKQSRISPLMKNTNMVVLDECVDIDFYYPRNRNRLKEELSISEEKIVLVCAAPFSNPRKGCKYFLEVAKRMEKDDRFVFVQVGYNVSDKSNLPSNYIPIGFLDDQEKLAQFYSLGDLFVFPSLHDTMPNACLEAMSAGTPLLCFNTSGMPYIAPSNICTLIEPRNIDQMIEVIKNTTHKTTDTIKKCREYAVSRYDNKTYHRKLLNIAKTL